MKSVARPMFRLLNDQRVRMGLSCAQLALRTGLSLRTVQRVLAGEESDPGFSTITVLAESLGISIKFEAEHDISSMRRRQAELKADEIVAMVQGTSGLESQAVSAETLRDLRERTINELLAGSSRRLWAR